MHSSPSQTFDFNTSATRLLRHGCFFVVFAVASLALTPVALAVDPPPDGGYPNQNTAEGDGALQSLAGGVQNTAIGNSALFSNTTGGVNTATGANALGSNTTGLENTANGVGALWVNTTGNNNTATGSEALLYNRTGNNNTATGANALNGSNSPANPGSNNTATGVSALFYNTIGHHNVANGVNALLNNTTGFQNTANGVGALSANKTCNGNTGEGFHALANNTGSFNTAPMCVGHSGDRAAGGGRARRWRSFFFAQRTGAFARHCRGKDTDKSHLTNRSSQPPAVRMSSFQMTSTPNSAAKRAPASHLVIQEAAGCG